MAKAAQDFSDLSTKDSDKKQSIDELKAKLQALEAAKKEAMTEKAKAAKEHMIKSR
jgi:hypothetical protein